MAVAAAFSDPRFRPLGSGELAHLHVKVSVLSPPARVKGPEDIRIGEHGVLLKIHGRNGVFLPEVAPEYGWTEVETLERLCTDKMFLPAESWKEGSAEIFVFTTQTFEEKTPSG